MRMDILNIHLVTTDSIKATSEYKKNKRENLVYIQQNDIKVVLCLCQKLKRAHEFHVACMLPLLA